MKQIRRFEIDYHLEWEYGVTIKQIRYDLDQIERLGATHVDIEAETHWDQSIVTIEAHAEREETDEEYKNRIRKEELKNKEIEKRERTQLKKLKEKYEN